jgi:hypothetical protein
MVNKIIASEPGVKTVDRIQLLVDAVPDNHVRALDTDAFQPGTCYAGAGDSVFRSMNNGQGWEPIGRFPEEEIERVKAYPREASTRPGRAGLLAVATALPPPAGGSRVYLSRDCGETWETGPQTRFRIEDMAWLDRDGVPSLLLATEFGLYELAGHQGAVPVQILVDPNEQDLGFYAVAVSTDVWGETSVAVAARGDGGIHLSSTGGRPRTFAPIGLKGELVRVLAAQHLGPHRYLWAGLAAPGTAPGKGCCRWRLTGSTESPEGWRGYHHNWQAGGCRALAFQGSTVLAASLRLGVLRLDLDSRDPRWEAPAINCGLPLRDVGRLQPVDTVATDPSGRLLFAGGITGVFRSKDSGVRYEYCSMKELSDEVTLPQTWLFCSGKHEIEVLSEDDTKRD